MTSNTQDFANLSGETPVKSPVQRMLAMVVDFTGTAPHYNQGLSKALAGYPQVLFRTSPYFGDRNAFQDSFLRKDLMGTARWLADRWPGVTSHYWLWKAAQLQGYLFGWRDVMKEVNRHRIPVLHVQWCKLPFFDSWMMTRAQRQGVRIVYTVHNALPHNNQKESVRRAYQKLYRQADALVVLSRFVAQQVLERVDDSVGDKIHVIEHGILDLDHPIPDRNDARVELELEPDAEVVMFMGRISAHKGIADLIDAFELARRERPKLRLVIAGEPQDSVELYQAQIQRLGISGIALIYPRFVSEQFKASLYAAADIAVMPHRESSQSGMGLEALAAGKPIVATRAGGLVELVEEEVNGYSVPVKDPVALGRALVRFFDLPHAEQAAMGIASRALGQNRFSWSMIAQRHVDLYQRIGGQRARGSLDVKTHNGC
jgi:glycosyltransferase involved in cell wall biosynthesis